jgi:hypothetical protein
VAWWVPGGPAAGETGLGVSMEVFWRRRGFLRGEDKPSRKSREGP